MDEQYVLNALNLFRNRLMGEVLDAFHSRGSTYGRERFDAWKRRFIKFLNEEFSGQASVLNAKLTHYAISRKYGESDIEQFWRLYGEVALSYIDSLIVDVEQDECELLKKDGPNPESTKMKKVKKMKNETQVFIVHGHDELTKIKTARFVDSLGFKAIILHEQASGGRTIIEKIETYTDVDFAIVLYTPDDKGEANAAVANGQLKPRARQNVVFEHGYLIGKLSRGHVAALVSDGVELPGDISGVVYVSNSNWQIDIAKEMKLAGLDVDFNLLAGS